MTEVYKMMKDDGNGGEAQFYPQTHAEAIIDLDKHVGSGEAGAKGEKGDPGLSAYQVAKSNGYTGSEKEWLASLKGATGATGPAGKDGAKGEKGETGQRGPQGPAGDSTIKLIKVKDV